MVSPVKVHHDILLLPNQQNEIAPSSVQREQRKGAVREQAGVRDQVAVVLEHRRPPHEQSRCQRRTPHGHHRARACRDVAPADEDLSSAPALNRSITQDDTRESCMRAGYIASNVISLAPKKPTTSRSRGPPPPPPPPESLGTGTASLFVQLLIGGFSSSALSCLPHFAPARGPPQASRPTWA